MIANIFLGISIALLPLFTRILPFDFNRDSKDYLFIVIAIVIMSSLGQIKRQVTAPMLISSIYIVFMITFNQGDPASPFTLLHTIEIAAGWFLFIRYYQCHEKEHVQYIYNGMIAGSLIQSIIAICGFFGFELYGWIISLFINVEIISPRIGSLNMCGSLGNNNLLASYLCTCIPAYFTLKNKYLVILPIVAVFLSSSVMGIASLLAALFYFINTKFNIISKVKLYLVSIFFMIVIPFFNIRLDSGRFEIWRRIINSASVKNWVIGIGPGGFANWKVRSHNGITFEQEHNSYLTIFNTFGMIGIVLFCWVFYKFTRRRDSNMILSVTLFVAFCNMWGHFAINQSTFMIIIIPMAALCLGGTHENNERSWSSYHERARGFLRETIQMSSRNMDNWNWHNLLPKWKKSNVK